MSGSDSKRKARKHERQHDRRDNTEVTNIIHNYNLKPAQADVVESGNGTNIIETAAHTGMMRYITYIKYNNIAAAQTITIVDSPVSGDAGATGCVTLDKQKIAADGTIMFPDSRNPNPEAPIMVIRSRHYLVGKTDVGTVQVTAQYYDE